MADQLRAFQAAERIGVRTLRGFAVPNVAANISQAVAPQIGVPIQIRQGDLLQVAECFWRAMRPDSLSDSDLARYIVGDPQICGRAVSSQQIRTAASQPVFVAHVLQRFPVLRPFYERGLAARG